MVILKDGTQAADQRLGRLVHFDPRSREWPVMAAIKVPTPRSYTWRQDPPVVNQGPVGACVAFGLGNEALGRPAPLAWPRRLDTRFLQDVYCEAQQIDPWPGTDVVAVCGRDAHAPHYGGTATLAGLQVMRRRGFFRAYRWAFGIEQAIIGVGRNGPALSGTWWRAGMDRPDSAGRIHYTGARLGGHLYVICAVDVSGVLNPLDGKVRVRNSWGSGWGDQGEADLSIRDWATALEEQGECAFAQRRTFKPAVFSGP